MYQPGDIVVLPFPYSDRLAEKRRPGLVISSSAFNQETGLAWIAMITSAKGRNVSGDVGIRHLAGTGLPVASTVRPAKIACVEHDRVLRVAGKLEAGLTEKARSFIVKTAGS